MTPGYNRKALSSILCFSKILTILFVIFTQFIFPVNAGAQIITRVAGQLKSACPTVPCGDGGLAIDAKLYSPSGMSVDQDGNIYISEFNNHALRKIDINTGIITTFAGLQRTGCTTAPCGDGGLASAARLNGPRGVHVDHEGHIYVADFSNHAIRKIDKNTGIITTVAGTIKSSCSAVPCGEGGLATESRLNSPTGVAFDSENTMYVADYGNHIIRKVDNLTGIMTTVAGTMKSSCLTAPCGDGGPATAAQLNGPSAIAFDADDNLFITEYGNHTVRRVDKLTGIITTYAGVQKQSCSTTPCGDGGLATDARLLNPFSLRMGPDNNLYISDASNAAIRKVDQHTNIITTVAGIPRSNCINMPCGEGELATNAQLSNPFAVDFSPDGNTLYILEYSNQALRKVTPMNLSSLPVQIKAFTAVSSGYIVNLNWESHLEENIDRYDIERSSDGTRFIKIGTITAFATGNEMLRYRWQDSQPLQGQNYYRIRSVDLDGSAKYSMIVIQSFEPGLGSIKISPNPVDGDLLKVEFSGNISSDEIELILYNALGQPIIRKLVSSRTGIITETLQLPAGLRKGVYTLFIGSRKEVIGRKRVLIR